MKKKYFCELKKFVKTKTRQYEIRNFQYKPLQPSTGYLSRNQFEKLVANP